MAAASTTIQSFRIANGEPLSAFRGKRALCDTSGTRIPFLPGTSVLVLVRAVPLFLVVACD